MNFCMATFSNPVGSMVLVGNTEVLTGVIFEKNWPRFKARYGLLHDSETELLTTAKRQLTEYFEGQRTTFDLPLSPQGTEFQRRVWWSLEQIPYGQTRSYKQQAASIAAPLAVRAVGRANGLNPISIVLPCHRVIGANGVLTGYGGGLAAKRFLIELEQRRSQV